MNAQRKNKILGILLLLVCAGGVIWGIVRQKGLNINHEIAIGEVLNFASGGRGNAGGIWINYVFTVNGKEYKSSSRYQTSQISDQSLRNHIVDKTFPIAYDPTNPSVSSILILPKDFSRFGHPFPDTLTWVLQYFKEE
jgi:hypothetical protein